MTLPAELQVGRRAREGPAPPPGGADGWLPTTESGLSAGYGKPPAQAGASYCAPARRKRHAATVRAAAPAPNRKRRRRRGPHSVAIGASWVLAPIRRWVFAPSQVG